MRILLCILLGLCAVLCIPGTIDKERYGDNVVVENQNLTWYWLLDLENEIIEVALECHCSGWIAWGFSRSGGMTDADVILGYVDTGGSPFASDFSIGNERAYGCDEGVCFDADRGGEDDVLAFNGSRDGEITQLIFTRAFDTGDDLDVQLDVKNPGKNTIMAGFHRTAIGTVNLPRHSITPEPKEVDLFTGATSTKLDIIVVHGALMFIAWYFIAPFCFFVARFLKQFKWWYPVHGWLMLIAMLATVAAFGIAVKETPLHFNDAHKIIGLIVVILGVAQPIIGMLANKFYDPSRAGAPIFPDKIHWVVGWIALILGAINVALGLQEYGKNGLMIAYSVILALTFAAVIGFTVFRVIKPSNSH